MQYIYVVLLSLFVIAMFACAIAMFLYVKTIKDCYNTSENEIRLFDFINIKDNIINVDHIVNIKRIQSVKDENYKILIELDDNKEPIIFDYDDNHGECNDVFTQIDTMLDSGIIVTD